MNAETPKERQQRYRENMRGLGYRRVERWERDDGSDSREFGERGKLALALALRNLLESVEEHRLTLEEYALARELWKPLLGKDFDI
jgi:hypothetical protein